MEYETKYDCYNGEFKLDGNHDDPNFIEVFHIGYIHLPSNPDDIVEVIIRNHDDIDAPCFHILTNNRSKELYRVSLFDNSITDGLTKEDKNILNIFLRSNYREYKSNRKSNVFMLMKSLWAGANLPDEDETPYDNIVDPPYYE